MSKKKIFLLKLKSSKSNVCHATIEHADLLQHERYRHSNFQGMHMSTQKIIVQELPTIQIRKLISNQGLDSTLRNTKDLHIKN